MIVISQDGENSFTSAQISKRVQIRRSTGGTFCVLSNHEIACQHDDVRIGRIHCPYDGRQTTGSHHDVAGMDIREKRYF